MLHELVKIVSKKKKRIGRGIGSGKGGHTVGRGHEGQKARAGFKVKRWFEGGQNPVIKSLPVKRGFRQPNKKEVIAINLSTLSTLATTLDETLQLDEQKSKSEKTGESTAKKLSKDTSPKIEITEEIIRSRFKIDKKKDIKILAKGGIKKAVVIRGIKVSKKAKAKIKKAGGKVLP